MARYPLSLPFPLPQHAVKSATGLIVIACHLPLVFFALKSVNSAAAVVVAFWWESVVIYFTFLISMTFVLAFGRGEEPKPVIPVVVPDDPQLALAQARARRELAATKARSRKYVTALGFAFFGFPLVFGCGFFAAGAAIAAGNEPTTTVAGLHVIIPNDGKLSASNGDVANALFDTEILIAAAVMALASMYRFVRYFLVPYAYRTATIQGLGTAFGKRIATWLMLVAVGYILIFIVPQLFAIFVICGKLFADLVGIEKEIERKAQVAELAKSAEFISAPWE